MRLIAYGTGRTRLSGMGMVRMGSLSSCSVVEMKGEGDEVEGSRRWERGEGNTR